MNRNPAVSASALAGFERTRAQLSPADQSSTQLRRFQKRRLPCRPRQNPELVPDRQMVSNNDDQYTIMSQVWNSKLHVVILFGSMRKNVKSGYQLQPRQLGNLSGAANEQHEL
jgi:hypothetical protein